jgi:SAM-dependent methyltransferase
MILERYYFVMDEQVKTTLMETLSRHAQSYIQQTNAQWQIRLQLPSPLTKQQFYRILTILRNTKDMKEEKPEEYLEVRPYVANRLEDTISLRLIHVHSIQDYCLNEDFTGLSKTDKEEQKWKWLKQKRYDADPLPELYSVKQMSVVNEWEELEEAPVFSELWSNMEKIYRYVVKYVYTDKENKIDYIVEVRKSTNKPFATMVEANVPYIPEEYYLKVVMRPDSLKKDKVQMPIENLCRLIYRHSLRMMQIQSGEGKLMTVTDMDAIMTKYGAMIRTARFIPRDKPDDSKTFFLAPKPVTLERVHLIEPGKVYCVTSVLENYAVTEKADGERMLLFIDEQGDTYLINNVPKPKHTGLRCTHRDYFNSILDGEYIEREHRYGSEQETEKDLFAVFDIYFVHGRNVANLPLISTDTRERIKSRYDWMQEVCQARHWDTSQSSMEIRSKVHRSGNKEEMFQQCTSLIRDAKQKKTWYPIDGLIFTPIKLPVLGYYPNTKVEFSYGMRWDRVYKWKPAELNTIDFLVKKGIRLMGPDGKVYQEFILQTGFNVDLMMEMDVLKGTQLLYQHEYRKHMQYGEGKYVPHVFRPFSYYQDGVHRAYIPVNERGVACAENADMLKDDTIVEFAYDKDDERHVSYRWRPLRVRDDKTRLYRKVDEFGNRNLSKTANDTSTANNVWRSIHRPVTTAMIEGRERVGEEEAPSCIEERIQTDDDVYYAREIPRFHLLSKNMLNFHNTFIKEKLYQYSKSRNASLLELACGRAGDLKRWCAQRYGFVLGIDFSKDNIIDPREGSFARTIHSLMRKEQDVRSGKIEARFAYMPPILYAVGDCALPIRDGSAAFAKEDMQSVELLQYVFDKKFPSRSPFYNVIPALRGKAQNGFDVVSCQFAVHYFFESREKLDGFFQNVADNLKPGGYFISTFMDGERVDRLLRGKNRAEGIVKESVVWAILKGYDQEFNSHNPYGNRIRVYLENINQLIPEYLVHFGFLVQYAETKGLRLVESKTFGETLEEEKLKRHSRSMQRILDEYSNEDPIIQQFSQLNRWVIFQKV